MKILNPADGSLIREIPETTETQVREAYARAVSVQPTWAAQPLPARIAVLEKFRELLELNKEKLAVTLTKEVGKPIRQSRNEINGARHRIDWICRHAAQYLADECMHREEGLEEWIVYEPLGIIANISAWNYPYLVGVNVFVPALIAGNAVLYKPSEYASLTGLHIAELLQEAGIPDDVFQCLPGGPEVGKTLLELPLDGYFFTGSHKTGKYIYEKVAPKMVPCQCELGGKDPLYVADDVKDVEAVAAAVADGAFYNNGQSCCAVERVYVHERIAEAFANAFVKEVKSWKMGDPMQEDVYIGALTRPQQADLLDGQVRDALAKGAQLKAGGKRIPGQGNFYEPTVLTGVSNDMQVMREESFGPIIGIMPVYDDKEALEKMKDTDYGLTASVYSSDENRARALISQLNTGTGYWNCCDRVSPALPWSGRQHSGFGATLSHTGIRAFTKPKALHLKK
jgi:acyl-CoA reductase-like NAD-dependent aldehyde dehydrogenase